MRWPTVPFESLYAEASRNGVYKSSEHHGEGVKIVNMGELFAHDVLSNQEMSRLTMSEAEMLKSGLVDGDLLFGRRSLVEAGAGKCSIVENPAEPTTFESSIIRVRLNPEIARPKFYFYWLRSHQGKAVIKAIVTGTNVKGIRGSDLKNIRVVHPSVDEQDSIVAILRTYDELIENNYRRIHLLEQSARLLYKEWFVNLCFPGHEHVQVVDGVPEGWKWEPLHELADITMGQSPESEFYNEDKIGLPFHQGVTDFGMRFLRDRIYCTIESRIAEPWDILFSVRAPVGRINITSNRIVIGRGLAAVRSKCNNQNFLFYQLKTHFFKEDMIGGGAIFAAITKKDLYNIYLLTPSTHLIDLFIENVRPIDKQIYTLHKTCEKLLYARNNLLPRLMTGEIAV